MRVGAVGAGKVGSVIVLVVATPGGVTRRKREIDKLWDSWSLAQALAMPIVTPAQSEFYEAYDVYAEKVVPLLPPRAIPRWDPALAASVADDIIEWAEQEGHSLILRGGRVASAFGLESFGEIAEWAGVRGIALPKLPADAETYRDCIEEFLDA